ncbi:MAG TPA: sensor histidine kinase [Pseudonocardiaceae bacterium]|nr:sensor histidine kinase [Pseudonocardiaceae bacterium]
MPEADSAPAVNPAPHDPPAPRDPAVPPPRLRLRSWQLVVLDVLTAAALTALAVYSTLDVATGLSSATAILVWLLALAVGLPLAVRRKWPVPVFGLVLGSTILAVLAGMSEVATVLAVAVALYPVALAAGRRCAAAALAVAVLGVTLAGVLSATVLHPYLVVQPGPESLPADLLSSLVFCWFSLVAGWALGRGAHARRAYAVRSAEHRVQQAVSEERLRIAREMHDVVAHSMSVIVMKAAVANHVYATRPEESRAALGHIEAVGRAALADIQHVLGSLRRTGPPGTDLASGTDLAPSPDLDALPGLIENARMAGVQVELDRGPVPALPAAVQLSAYRIVQEALTNVIKHAAPARCTVRVAAEAGELHVAVIDDGTPRSRSGGAPGHGLIGMRERAALHHRTLTADRRPEGGFAVHARLPYEAHD